MAKILITGGAGFIGKHLANELSARGEKVYLFDKQKKDISFCGKFLKGDVMNLRQVISACSEKDGIIHLAAISRVSLAKQFPHFAIGVNTMGTLNVLEGIRLTKNRPWLILGSTREVNYNWHSKGKSCDFREIDNLYGISKFIAELLCYEYVKEYGLRVVILRFSDTYGSCYDNREKVLPKLILKSLNNSGIIIHNPGQKFDFIHYKDLTRGIYLASRFISRSKPAFLKEIVLCTGRSITLKELVEFIVKQTNSASKIRYELGACSKSAKRLFDDTRTAESLFGFSAEIPLEEGIRDTIQSFERNKVSLL